MTNYIEIDAFFTFLPYNLLYFFGALETKLTVLVSLT